MGHRRKSKESNNMVKTAVMGTAAAIGCIGLGIATFLSMNEPIADEYGCYDALPSAGHKVVVFDTSEPRWNNVQHRSLLHHFESLFSTLAFNQRLSVYTNEGDKASSVLRPAFILCGVGTSPQEWVDNGLDEVSAGFLKKRRENVYNERVKPYLDTLLALKASEDQYQNSQSPLLEIMGQLSKTALASGDSVEFITDGVQFTESAQFCRSFNDMPPYSAFQKRAVFRNRLAPNTFNGIDVNMLMLQRDGYGQDWLKHCHEDEIAAFWRDYFTDNGAGNFFLTRVRLGHVSK